MASSNYAACLRAVLRYEGGKVDDPRDPGGRTNQGVTQRVYTAYRRSRALLPQDVYRMSDAERDAIYKRQYWDEVGGDALAAGLDLVAFDAAVNSGVARAKQWLSAAHGMPIVKGIDACCDARLHFLQHLSTWRTFGRGWSNRVADVRLRAKAMAIGK